MKITKEKIIKLENYILIDVREKDEYNDFHIENALSFPLSSLESSISTLEKYKNCNIVLYCRSGKRSSVALEIFKDKNFKYVYDLGSINNWYK